MTKVVSYLDFKRSGQVRELTCAEQRRRLYQMEIGTLVFRCIATAGEVNSGIDMDRQTFLANSRNGVLAYCRYCQRIHRWKVGSGFLMPFAASESRKPERVLSFIHQGPGNSIMSYDENDRRSN